MKKARLLWIDLEMTGLEPARDVVLELAAIATDWKLREIATFQATVRQEQAAELMTGDFWQQHAATRTALLQDNAATGRPLSEVEADLAAFVRQYFPVRVVARGERRNPIYIAGNSVHQDRRFLRRYFPEVDELFHYRMLDVSAWKLIFRHKYHRKIQKPEVHRALDDIRGSIEEMSTYLDWVEQGIKPGVKRGK